MRNFRIATLLLTVLLIMAGVVSADQQNKKTVFTFKDSVQVPGSTLPAGTYVFKLANSDANRHIVQIYNQDETKLITTILAVPNSQLTPSGETIITYAKAPANQPAALEAWFYPGDNFGQQFVYPEGVASELSTLNTLKVPSTGSEQAYPNSSTDTMASANSGSTTANAAATTTTTTTTTTTPTSDTMSSNSSNQSSAVSTPSSSASSMTPSSSDKMNSNSSSSSPATTSSSANSSNPSSTDNMSSSSAAKRSDDMKPRSDDTTASTTSATPAPSSTQMAQTETPAATDNMNRNSRRSDTSAYSSQNPNSSSQATSDTSSQPQSDRSQNLPRTASPLPLAGLLGFLSISAAIVLRKLSL